jgi:parallel beta-helix repeat protein
VVGWYPAIDIHGVSNVTVKNLIIVNCSSGIDFSDYIGSFNVTVINNLITGCSGNAIFSSNSSNSVIAENEITRNGGGIDVWGSQYINISGNNITQNDDGIVDLGDSPNAMIYANNIVNNTRYSLSVGGPQDNITENIINNNGQGVSLGSPGDSGITGNIIMSNGNLGGISLPDSNGNAISGNFVSNNSLGIRLWDCIQNKITENMVTDDNGWGIQLVGNSGSVNNTICHNNFVNNKTPGLQVSIPLIYVQGTWPAVWLDGPGNVWDDDGNGNY